MKWIMMPSKLDLTMLQPTNYSTLDGADLCTAKLLNMQNNEWNLEERETHNCYNQKN